MPGPTSGRDFYFGAVDQYYFRGNPLAPEDIDVLATNTVRTPAPAMNPPMRFEDLTQPTFQPWKRRAQILDGCAHNARVCEQQRWSQDQEMKAQADKPQTAGN